LALHASAVRQAQEKNLFKTTLHLDLFSGELKHCGAAFSVQNAMREHDGKETSLLADKQGGDGEHMCIWYNLFELPLGRCEMKNFGNPQEPM